MELASYIAIRVERVGMKYQFLFSTWSEVDLKWWSGNLSWEGSEDVKAELSPASYIDN